MEAYPRIQTHEAQGQAPAGGLAGGPRQAQGGEGDVDGGSPFGRDHLERVYTWAHRVKRACSTTRWRLIGQYTPSNRWEW